MNEVKKYVGSKMYSKMKTIAATAIIAGTLLAPGMTKDAEAAGAMHNMNTQQKEYVYKGDVSNGKPTVTRNAKGHIVYKPTQEQLKKLDNTMQEYYDERQELNEHKKNSQYRSSGNNFKDSLRTDNPNSEYYQSDYERHSDTNSVKISNSKIHGNNVRIGEVDDGRDRY